VHADPVQRDVYARHGHDQQMAHGSRAAVCQRAVGSHSLPGYGPVISVNRPVRTRMPGGVGAGGEKPLATRLSTIHRVLIVSQIDRSRVHGVIANNSHAVEGLLDFRRQACLYESLDISVYVLAGLT
jgi:hypothetical protein